MSQFPTFTAGSRATAAQLQALAPIRLVKAVDQSLTSNATLQNDADLVIPVIANATYDFDGFLFWTGNETGDIKFAMNAPAGSTLDWGMFGPNEADAGFSTGGTRGGGEWWMQQGVTTFPTGAIPYAGSTALLIGALKGRVAVGSTAGNVTLQWAQNVSNATTTKLKAGSWLHAQRVA